VIARKKLLEIARLGAKVKRVFDIEQIELISKFYFDKFN
jgi:hypothetical protein